MIWLSIYKAITRTLHSKQVAEPVQPVRLFLRTTGASSYEIKVDGKTVIVDAQFNKDKTITSPQERLQPRPLTLTPYIRLFLVKQGTNDCRHRVDRCIVELRTQLPLLIEHKGLG
jgi:hypothetical protein